MSQATCITLNIYVQIDFENILESLRAYYLADFQMWIGYVDVKSLPPYFNVQKTYNFNTSHIPIPFDNEKQNVGGAMNLSSGIFSATRAGKYFFLFSGLAKLPTSSGSELVIDL